MDERGGVRRGTACSLRIGAYVIGHRTWVVLGTSKGCRCRATEYNLKFCVPGLTGFGLGTFQNITETELPSPKKVGIAGRTCQRSSEECSGNEKLG